MKLSPYGRREIMVLSILAAVVCAALVIAAVVVVWWVLMAAGPLCVLRSRIGRERPAPDR